MEACSSPVDIPLFALSDLKCCDGRCVLIMKLPRIFDSIPTESLGKLEIMVSKKPKVSRSHLRLVRQFLYKSPTTYLNPAVHHQPDLCARVNWSLTYSDISPNSSLVKSHRTSITHREIERRTGRRAELKCGLKRPCHKGGALTT